MKKKILPILYFSLLALFIAVSAILAFVPEESRRDEIRDVVCGDAIESLLQERYLYMSEKAEYVLSMVSTRVNTVNVEFFDSLASDFADYGVGFFHYEMGRLQHWSTNDIPVPVEFSGMFAQRSVVLGNGIYLCCMKLEDNHAVVGMYQLKKEYSYENDKLEESFGKSIDLPASVNLSVVPDKNSLAVRLPASDKDIFFSMPDEQLVQDRITLAQVMRLCLLAFVIIALVSVFEILARKYTSRSWLLVFIFAISLVVLRFLLQGIGFFNDLDSLQMFSPESLSTSYIQSSYGELLINILLFVIWAMFFCRYFNPKIGVKNGGFPQVLVNILLAVVMSGTSIIVIDFISQVVLDSSIPFSFVNWSDFDWYGYATVLLVAIVAFSAIFVVRKLVRTLSGYVSMPLLHILLFILLASFAVTTWIIGNDLIAVCLIFWAIWVFVLYCDINDRRSFVMKTALMILVSLLVACLVTQKTLQKEAEAYKVLAYNMSTERDFDVEFNFMELDAQIRGNKEIDDAVKNYDFELSDSLLEKLILKKKYLKRYDYRITTCIESDSIFFDEEGLSYGCFEYFRSMVLENGIIIPNTNFYYLDNNNGLMSYLGIFSVNVEPGVIVKIYIEFDSKIFSEGLGYPDLMLDSKMSMKHNDRDYDFARYSKGVLVASRGSYRYLFSLKPENDFREYSVGTYHGYRHFKYCPDEENIVILSKRDTTYSNAFILFFFVLLCVFVAYVTYFCIDRVRRVDNLSATGLGQRFRASFIGTLAISMFLTMVVSVFFIVETYNNRQKEAVLDKVHSVAVELDHSFDLGKLCSEDPQYVDDVLVYLSNILYVDINIYDVHGVLVSSSRNEFFRKGLKGMFMDPNSYRHLIMNKDELFVHEEVIDKANYLSVYLPLKDKNNRVVAYLNLPYFAADDEIEDEMSNYVAVFASIFLLLIIVALVIGLIVSRQVTIPLSMMQDSISGMELNKAKKIKYGRNDEIGLLISEYNRKVDELAESAQKLAASERESAWREMARQIAHEIRNPLTPMKLRIQYLERAYRENTPGWEKMLDQLPQMLIEQIDVLDATASQFSEFAKMQLPRKSKVNLCEIIDNCVDLHNGTNGVEVLASNSVGSEAFVLVDRDQILRVFTNLIKNSIQAIPEGRKGKVTISLTEVDGRYDVSVQDNGCGIADDVKTKIFQPNFTTKSSGMGLGLSMVKNILFGNGVEIDFETEVGVGTNFKLCFDKWKE